MAVRAKPAEVKEIISTSIGTSIIETIITTANTIVNSNLTGKGLSDNVLKQIEMWLSAHLIASTYNRQAQSKKVGDAKDDYAKLGMNFKSTTYGQTAILLDSSGSLVNVGMKSASIEAVPSFDDSPVYNL